MSLPFRRGTTPFERREALSDDWTPETLVGREDELADYHAALEPVIWGDQPKNIFLYGKTGVGKTAATRYLLTQLEQDAQQYDDLSITVTEVNCEGLSTSYRVCVEIVNTLRSPDNQISTSGHPTSDVYRMLWEELEALGGTVLLVLDEIDHVDVGEDGFLYQISRARENNNLEDTQVGIIGISNDLSFTGRLSPKVRSSLCERKINFPAYDAAELQNVLEQRASVAFHDGALEEGTIPLCAAYGAKQAGDARKALDLLREAGDIAREQDRDTVTETDVNDAKSEVERQEITDGVEGLHTHDRYLLFALAELAANGETPARSREVYPQYRDICDSGGVDALKSRGAHDHLNELAMLGLIEFVERNRGKAGGKYRQYELAEDTSLVQTALQETIENEAIRDRLSTL